ncbi:hypothetical protein ACQKDY_00545 [Alteromonas macleodii]|uniref:hypothetical protein n=1 Tax=Alteromonas macleodii TaxID=28108 RepID=UPI003CFDBF0F
MNKSQKRASLPVEHATPSNVFPIDPKEMVLEMPVSFRRDGDLQRINVFRLLYKNVPEINRRLKTNIPINAEVQPRKKLVVDTYKWLERCASGDTALSKFRRIVGVFRFFDERSIPVEMNKENVSLFGQHLFKEVRKGNMSVGNANTIKNTFSSYLNGLGFNELVNELPQIPKGYGKTDAYSDVEIKSIARRLFKVFNKLSSAYLNDEEPECPFGINHYNGTWASNYMNNTAWLVKLVVSAAFLTIMFTGDNTTPILKMRRKDIGKFSKKTSGHWLLKSAKGRQHGRVNSWELGFTERGKRFFELYLTISELIDPSEDAYLFPYVKNGIAETHIVNRDLMTFNRWFLVKYEDGIRLTPKRFRQTKSDLLITLTNSISITAEGLNNSGSTVQRHYMNGNPSENKGKLASASEAIELMGRGKSLKQAKTTVYSKFKEPLTLEELTQKKQSIPAPTDVGSRCEQPFGVKAQKLKAQLLKQGIVREEDSVACFKFLDCFECEYQALIAEVDDIWCLLSFKDSIIDAISAPAVNHIPPEKLRSVLSKVENMLDSVQSTYPEVFHKANEKNKHKPHPAWNDEYAVFDHHSIW